MGSQSEELPAIKAVFVVRNLEGGTSGNFTVQVHPDWGPEGAARFAELLRIRFFDGCRFFRVIKGFVAQFGINGDPSVNAVWNQREIRDDTVRVRNSRGRVTFASGGPGTRTTQLFVNQGDNAQLDSGGFGFAPFAEVIQGMDVVDRIFSGYGESAPNGRGPDQLKIQQHGNQYLEAGFPHLSYIQTVDVIGDTGALDVETLADYEQSKLPISPMTVMALVILGILAGGVLLLAWVLGVFDRPKQRRPKEKAEPDGNLRDFVTKDDQLGFRVEPDGLGPRIPAFWEEEEQELMAMVAEEMEEMEEMAEEQPRRMAAEEPAVYGRRRMGGGLSE
eukprot:TRINITY_DN106367_c0_g1_i1.p1 TRINITY_DN106367_c0_g1~~TRINITY_DN106367_c0_g1_i1.p1  ORF type:complete len:333 (-),score=90.71 TRINITY_DN106367_c0_g1_i1:95-1093(-)